MKLTAFRRSVSNGPRVSMPLRIAAATLVAALVAALVAGCHGQLAHKHEFFAQGSAAGARNEAETQRVLAYYRALQAAQHGCSSAGSVSAVGDAVPLEATVASGQPVPQQPWASHCPGAEDSRAAHGGASNSYRRWVEDRVRPLPDPSQTASSIGSGS